MTIFDSEFGSLHRLWVKYPAYSAIIAAGWYFVVIVASILTDRAFNFYWQGKLAKGFICSSHWGWLYLFAMPIASLLVPCLIRAIDNSLFSLDDFIKDQGSKINFSDYISNKIKVFWRRFIFPVSLFFSIGLTLMADYEDIFSPITGRGSGEIDWSNQNPSLFFNVLAWSMQIYLAYCGLVSMILVSTVFGVIFIDGLDGNWFHKWFAICDEESEKKRKSWIINWDFSDSRRGLKSMDSIFFSFTLVSTATLLICNISIVSNQHLYGQPDTGSIMLSVVSLLLLPVLAALIFFPYFTSFSNANPPETYKGIVVHKSYWPYGCERLTFILLSISASLWLYSFDIVLEAVFNGFCNIKI